MWLMPIISLAKANWKPIVAVLLVIAWSWYWYAAGKGAVRAEWEAEKSAQIMAIQAEKDRLQDEANQKSKELETALNIQRDKNRKLNTRLANEIRKNDTAYNCPIPTDGLLIFNDSVTESNTAR